MESESGELCGVPGGEDETITKGEFNRLASTIKYYHFRPMKAQMGVIEQMLKQQNSVMSEHIESDREFFATLRGAKWALYAIAACLAPTVPIIYYLVKALTEAGVL